MSQIAIDELRVGFPFPLGLLAACQGALPKSASILAQSREGCPSPRAQKLELFAQESFDKLITGKGTQVFYSFPSTDKANR